MDGTPRKTRHVVITAVGAVTAHGIGAEALWKGSLDGTVAIRPLEAFAGDGSTPRIGGAVQELPVPAHDYASGLGGARDPALDFALTAAQEALAASGLTGVSPERWGIAFGSCNGGTRSGELELSRTRESGGAAGNPFQPLLVSPQALAEALSAAFGIKGPVLSVNTACASGAHALAHALETIRGGRADAMLVGGSDAFTETAFAGFASLQSLSGRPAAPYSRDRDGLSLGEGSGMLVLAEESVARRCGAPVLARLLGYGLSADGYHATAPHPEGEGAARAIRGAMSASGISAEDIGYINGHGTGTRKNDEAESNAVRAALGEAAEKTPLSSTKSMVGHLLGAAGAVEAVVTVLALRDQTLPPTAGFTGIDPKCALDSVPLKARPQPVDVALSNNFAFAGANATVALARPGTAVSASPEDGGEDVVVTGIGVVTAGGQDPDALWDSYRAGERLGGPRHGLWAAPAEFDPDRWVPPRERRRMDRLGLLAVAACHEALAHAGLETHDRVGVMLGTGLGPMRSTEEFCGPVLAGGSAAANPAVFPNTVFNAAAGQVAMLLGAKGPTSTLTAGHAAGASALSVAHDLLRTGRADAVLCPAVDDLSATVLGFYGALPLFRGAAGRRYTLADGGVALLLERASAARARGARPLAEFVGHGTASDALGIGRWDAHGAGVERAMRNALADSGLEAADLESVWANAAGLAAVDRPEARAIGRLVGGSPIPVHAPKRVVGEPVGAGAQLAAALAITGWRRTGTSGPVLVNSSSLGGTHISLVFRPATEN